MSKQRSGSPCYIYNMVFWVAAFGSKKTDSEIREIQEKLYGIFPKKNDVDERVIIAHWLAEFGVLNWENVKDEEDGEEIKFSRSFARQLFLNESYYRSLNKALINHASDFENYLNDAVLEDAEQIKKP